jgi:hypothetical protein
LDPLERADERRLGDVERQRVLLHDKVGAARRASVARPSQCSSPPIPPPCSRAMATNSSSTCMSSPSALARLVHP